MEHSSSIKSAVKDELFRIGCFLLYYILLIGLGVAILVGAFWGAYYLIFNVLLHVGSIRAMVLLVMVAVGLSLLALMLGVYLIKPLFSFKSDSKENRIEVFETECPELFTMIREVADQTRCPMPKHVYLSPDVNACVFYDTSFWSIFFPVRKNLEIGLGLFDGTSVEEVKSVVAHEFGHFSQNSMKVGSTVYVTNTVLYNLIFTDDFWDKWMDEWCTLDTGILRYFGVLTRWFTNLIKHQTVRVYTFVQKGYLRLSRFMEYDADRIACRCVGTETFVSALCKIEVLANKDDLYRRMLHSLVDEKKMFPDYFAGKRIMSGLLPHTEMPPLSFDKRLKEPVRTYKVEPRVKVEDIWASHPSLEERIANAWTVTGGADSTVEPLSSWTLIPQKISGKVSALLLSIISKNAEKTLIDMPEEQFEEWITGEINENFMDERLRPFFGGTLFKFDLDAKIEVPSESPFTKDNAMKVAELMARMNDWQLLNQVKEREIDIKEVSVDDVVYKRKDIPFERFKAELDTIYEEVTKIYGKIYTYVRSKCNEEEAMNYRSAFVALFYSQHIEADLLPQLFAHRDNLYQELTKATRRDEEEYAQLCADVKEYENHLKRTVSELDLDWMARTFNKEEYVDGLKEYLNTDHNSSFQVDTDVVNEMFQLTDSLSDVQEMIYGSAKRTICGITKQVISA